MKDTDINIAIAEDRGWQWYRIPHSEKNSRGPMKTLFLPEVHEIDQDPIWLQPGQDGDRIATWEYMHKDGMVQDYRHDLNAIIPILPDGTDIHLTERSDGTMHWVVGGKWHAAEGPDLARAACEYFLKTIRKWRDE